ncbi:MAG: hypothetical protein K8F91_17025 [Candidatus Obscuribacterales bacterium]|nr:hypothetical protein [Candidatus Obscuribacterales bacterium]
MDNDLDKALQVDVLARLLQADKQQSAEMVETLAKMLLAALPEYTTVKRGGFILSKTRPVVELNVVFETIGYQIVKSKHGTVSAKEQKIVRGIALKSCDIDLEDCIDNIVSQLAGLAESNAIAKRALNNFIDGR